ncbi:MAG TPA: hypothetical protein VM689_02740 [Aliidongia sp.]|nr:hypothetical protein [Aliidongia sp.]
MDDGSGERAGYRKILANILAISLILIIGSTEAHADCAPPADGPPLCLVGTITSHNYSAALIEQAGKTGLETLHQGGEVLDWHVLQITPRAVMLGQNDRQVRLAISDHDDVQAVSDQTPAEPNISSSESIAARIMKRRAERAKLGR